MASTSLKSVDALLSPLSEEALDALVRRWAPYPLMQEMATQEERRIVAAYLETHLTETDQWLTLDQYDEIYARMMSPRARFVDRFIITPLSNLWGWVDDRFIR